MSDNFIPPTAKIVHPDPEETAPKYTPPPPPKFSLRKCLKCSGYGKGLIVHNGLCRSCNLSTFPPLTDTELTDGWFSISDIGDNSVLKKIVKLEEEYVPENRVMVGSRIKIHHVSRLLSNNEIYSTSRSEVDGKLVGGTDDEEEIIVGRGNVIKGLDIALLTMVLGETSLIKILSPSYSYLTNPSLTPKVKLGDSLLIEVKVTSCGDILPRFPTKEELEATKQSRKKEAEQELKENPPVPYQERRSIALKEKDLGNVQFSLGNYKSAKSHYDNGFINIFIHRDEWSHFVSDSEKELFNEVKSVLHLNRCCCRLKMGELDDALWDADKSIEFHGGDYVKGHFRRMQVYVGFLRRELEKEKGGKYWDVERAEGYAGRAREDWRRCGEILGGKVDGAIEKSYKVLEGLENVLAKVRRKYEKDQKKLYKDKIVKGLDENYRKLKIKKERRKKKEDEDEDEDMPELED
ncbi:hypothetical protein TrST_g12747 [Triparma strigata]|uniref:peptidylprolyl isomerase n=1 Tax=Triparma strigata TaxID=1606541 RepID=A0A9W7C8I6_9STRA|nr:hypothetical protein TrST_g12747 [Triparma strigata]